MGRSSIGPNGEFEDVVFGAHALGDNIGEHLRWYDARLRGVANGIDEEPPVRLFVMGVNAWRSEWEWPLARPWTDEFLQPGGGLSMSAPPAGAPVRLHLRPRGSGPVVGRAVPVGRFRGPRDRRAVEQRPDVLVFESQVLPRDVEVTGPIEVELWAATDARPRTGRPPSSTSSRTGARSSCAGICRQRYAHDLLGGPGQCRRTRRRRSGSACGRRPTPSSPAWVRLEISSSNFARFDRNPNTGHPTGLDAEMRVARQTVFHDAARPSRLILPVIPPRS